MSSYHVPVLAAESVDLLVANPDGVYVDCTFGGGGHARLILERLSPKGTLIAFDQDPDAFQQVREINDDRLVFVAANFRFLERHLMAQGYPQIDGLLADLGVSSHQFDVPERGFSYRFDAPLDMRMAQDGISAADLLARLDARQLQELLSNYGELRNAKSVAEAIVSKRQLSPIQTTADLFAVLEPYIRGQRHRYLAQVFQALRIAVNDEMGALEDLLSQAQRRIITGGHLVMISYHSGEDRLVKNFMRSGMADGQHHTDEFGRIWRPWAVLTKRPIEAPAAETLQNSRARSARLRAARRSDEQGEKH